MLDNLVKFQPEKRIYFLCYDLVIFLEFRQWSPFVKYSTHEIVVPNRTDVVHLESSGEISLVYFIWVKHILLEDE